jgi:hypothetical protein
MKRLIPLAALLITLLPDFAPAQQALPQAPPPAIARIDKVRVGFKPYNENAAFGRSKVGLWTPVYVEITAGPNGLPKQAGAWIKVETPDFEGVGTIYRTPVVLGENETGVFLAYTKSGSTNPDVNVELHVGNRTFRDPTGGRFLSMELHGHSYLALGRRIGDLPAALSRKEDKEKQDNVGFQDDSQRKTALFEDDASLLPAHWYGYDGIDMVFLSTDSKDFLTRLADQGHTEQLKALVQWVRRGGRLVIPVARQTQERLANLLGKGAWQPPVPVIPPAETPEKFKQPERLAALEHWGDVNNLPLPNAGEKPPVVAQLEPAGINAGDWEVEARAGVDGPPLIARVRYGLGQIVYLAFSLDDPVISQWAGRDKFLRTFIVKVAPRSGLDLGQQNQRAPRGFGNNNSNDVTSQLYNNLDNFDVRVIPFGVVALFIVLYVLVVGPLEFFLLKYLFGRLEWTWITFPAVVLSVSVIAYFAAYALKGQDLKVNKVDIVDIDLRTGADAQRLNAAAHVYGQTFLMILSPRIQSYTLGIEPNPEFWGDAKPARPLSADLVSWMARPDENDFGGMGRGSGQGFFRRPYFYGDQPDGAVQEETLPDGITGVPIPVWMSKAFSASWEATTATPPVVADLVYHRHQVENRDIKVSGTLRSNLAVDLEDVWLFYADRCYQIEKGLPGKSGGAAGAAIKVAVENGIPCQNWFGQRDNTDRPTTSQGLYDPTNTVKQMLFHEEFDQTRRSLANHSMRRVDLSWRLYKEPPGQDRRTREAILFGRVRFAGGTADEVAGANAPPLPTHLWFDKLPGSGVSRPGSAGSLNQDTFVRVLLPVKPAGN